MTPQPDQGEVVRVEWQIEVCGVCGIQLGPGLNSPTATGRCPEREHHHVGGVIVTVTASPEQAAVLARRADRAAGASAALADQEGSDASE